MPTHSFRSGRIRQAQYDPAMRHLELLWDDKTVRAYQPVPEEVFRRLCQAPNPATYWEDRIAEEYPSARPRRAAGAPDAAQQFKDLFGGGD